MNIEVRHVTIQFNRREGLEAMSSWLVLEVCAEEVVVRKNRITTCVNLIMA